MLRLSGSRYSGQTARRAAAPAFARA